MQGGIATDYYTNRIRRLFYYYLGMTDFLGIRFYADCKLCNWIFHCTWTGQENHWTNGTVNLAASVSSYFDLIWMQLIYRTERTHNILSH